jgi:hypothetical protein
MKECKIIIKKMNSYFQLKIPTMIDIEKIDKN